MCIRDRPITVLSRCQRFDLRRVDAALLVAHLQGIAGKEEITAEAEALALIARAAEGSVRDALSLFDQAIAHAAEMCIRDRCNTDQQLVEGVPEVPTDYRQRHPITLSEADHRIEIFVGSNRGALSATQRADVLAFAQTWRREATGGVVVDLPVGTSNARAAAEAMREIGSILRASGVPPQGIVAVSYTHLDVYKRQGRTRVGARRRTCPRPRAS